MRSIRLPVQFSRNLVLAALGASVLAHGQNLPPVVDAGVDSTYKVSDTQIRLRGSATDDQTPEDALVLTWTRVSGPSSVQILSESTPISRVTFTDTGTYLFELRVSDGTLSAADTVSFIIIQNLPFKVLSPSDDQQVEVGKPFHIRWQMDPPLPCRVSYLLDGWTTDSIITLSGAVRNGDSGVVWEVDPNLPVGARGVVNVIDYGTPTNYVEGTFVLVGAAAPATSLKQVGTPVVSVTNPNGGGSRNLELIRDGVYPISGSFSDSYDTYDGDGAAEAFFGYTFTQPYRFTKLVFLIGSIDPGQGGTFISPKIQVLQNDSWVDAAGLQSDPVYDINLPAFSSVAFTFTPLEGTGIRIIGMEQAAEPYVSCAELDVEGTPVAAKARRVQKSAGSRLVMTVVESGNKVVFSLPVLAGPNNIRPQLEISDLAGRKVRTIDCSNRAAVVWDLTTETRGKAISGLYIARLTTGTRSAATRILVR